MFEQNTVNQHILRKFPTRDDVLYSYKLYKFQIDYIFA
jgi:hypothetical protein